MVLNLKKMEIEEEMKGVDIGLSRVQVTALECINRLRRHGSSPDEAERIVYLTLKEMEELLLDEKFDQAVQQLKYIFLDAPMESLIKIILKYK